MLEHAATHEDPASRPVAPPVATPRRGPVIARRRNAGYFIAFANETARRVRSANRRFNDDEGVAG
jgi:hypothetical protein